MSSDSLRETPESRYESPTMTVVGMVSELTAGPITKDSESSGGFKGTGGEHAPRTDDTRE